MEEKNDSQIDRAFKAATNHLSSFLNPPLTNPGQQPLKDALDKAFESIRKAFDGKFERLGKPLAISDEEMVNVVQVAICYYQTITTVEEAIVYIAHDLNGLRNNIERVAENQWVIRDQKAFRALEDALVRRYRTLEFKRT